MTIYILIMLIIIVCFGIAIYRMYLLNVHLKTMEQLVQSLADGYLVID